MFVGMALSKVLAGGATAPAVGDEMARVVAEYQAVCATFERDADAGLRALGEFEARYPPLADFLPAVSAKLFLLLRHGKPGEAKAYAERLVTKVIRQHNAVVLELACLQLRDKAESKDLVALAVRAAEALVRLDGGTDAQSLIRLADAYHVSGDQAKAKAYAGRALAAARGEPSAFQESVEKEARRLGVERKPGAGPK
jgi:hypothetical protein